MIKKLLISLLFICFISFCPLFADIKSGTIYGIYSDTARSIVWEQWGTNENNIGYSDWFSGVGSLDELSASPGYPAYEGANYLRAIFNSAGMHYYYFSEPNQNMAAFYGGEIEMRIRMFPGSNPSLVKIGFIKGTNNNTAGDSDESGLVQLPSTFPADGAWHKFTIPLTTATLSQSLASDLTAVARPLAVKVSGAVTFDLDHFIWKTQAALQPGPNIGSLSYGVYSDRAEGASFDAANEDKVEFRWYQANHYFVPISTMAYEGDEYYRVGSWSNPDGFHGIAFSNVNGSAVRDMRAYENGAIELYIRISSAAANYSNIRVGMARTNDSAGNRMTRSLSDLGYKANGQWQRVVILLDSSLGGLTTADLANTRYLFFVETHSNYDIIDIDHVIWRKAAALGETYENKTNSIYGIYSDWLSGTGALFGASGSLDNVGLWPLAGAPAVAVNGTAFEGSNYFVSPSSGYWGIGFEDAPAGRSMSEFYNGTLEFWVRGTNLSAVSAGIKCNGKEQMTTLGALGITSTNGEWQKVSIPLNADGFAELTRAVMLETTEILFMINNNGAAVDIDYIVWKKSNYSTSAMSVSLILKNRDSSAGAGKITWNNDSTVFGSTTPVAANQYVEVELSDSELFHSNVAWGLQIYTDNSEAGNAAYTGEMTTSTISGLVAENYTFMLIPMLWRASDSIFSMSDSPELLVNPEWMAAWSPMRDITAKISDSETSFYPGREEIRFCDRRGFKYATVNDWGQIGYGDLAEGRKIYLYFSADFSKARKGYAYKSNTITIELFYE